jgi:hypothetical protein
MSGRCLLDTNVIIALFADEREVKGDQAAECHVRPAGQ